MPSGAVVEGRGRPLQPKSAGLPGITRQLRQHVEADPTMMLDELVYHMYQRTGKYIEVHSMQLRN